MAKAYEDDLRRKFLTAYENGDGTLEELRVSGMVAPMTVEAATDGEIFLAYVEHFLCPQLRPEDVVVMDNLSLGGHLKTDFMTASAPSARIHWLRLNDRGLGRRSRA